jgi:hypothetical protein
VAGGGAAGHSGFYYLGGSKLMLMWVSFSTGVPLSSVGL